MSFKILLADDNPTFLESVALSLCTLPHVRVVGRAHDGREALELAAELQPDLILLDIAMPHVSGLDVARTMQSWVFTPSIVFLSMHDGQAYRDAAHDLGALDFVGKSDFVSKLLPLVSGLVAAAQSRGEVA